MSDSQPDPLVSSDPRTGAPDLGVEPQRVDDPQDRPGAQRPIVDPAGEQVMPEELTEGMMESVPDPGDRTGVHDRAGDRTEQS